MRTARPFMLASSAIDDDGGAAFRSLAVATGAATSGEGVLPFSYLCDATVIIARAVLRAGSELHGEAQLASTHHVVVSPPCP